MQTEWGLQAGMMRGLIDTLALPMAGIVFCLCLLIARGPALHAQETDAGSITAQIPLFIDPNRAFEKPSDVPRSITFLTTLDFPPFNFVTPEGRLTGFHVDLSRAICDELQVRCQMRVVAFNRIVRGLVDGKGDAAIAGLAESRRNRRRLRFTLPYLRMAGRFASNRNEQLAADARPGNGASVSVVAESAHAGFVAEYFPGLTVAPYDDAQSARQALKDGLVDVHFGDALSLSFWLQSETADGCCGFYGGAYFDETYFGRGLSIALPKEATALRSTLNYALQRLVATGKFSELYLRYFPITWY